MDIVDCEIELLKKIKNNAHTPLIPSVCISPPITLPMKSSIENPVTNIGTNPIIKPIKLSFF